MYKQFLINKYFKKLCNAKFFKNDEDAIIGRAKDVIKCLQDGVTYVKDPINEVNEENRDFLVEETALLIKDIQNDYHNMNNVIGLTNHPMLGFYVLQDKTDLYNELKEYYEEMEEKDDEY
jgi:hypothetical protein